MNTMTFSRIEKRLAHPAVRSTATAAAAAIAVLLFSAAGMTAPQPNATTPGRASQPRVASDDAALGPVRSAAAAGDVDAAVQVTRQLLDRFDADGRTDQLYEATIWIDRFHGTETMARSKLIERVSLSYCNQKILHYHWLCEPGE